MPGLLLSTSTRGVPYCILCSASQPRRAVKKQVAGTDRKLPSVKNIRYKRQLVDQKQKQSVSQQSFYVQLAEYRHILKRISRAIGLFQRELYTQNTPVDDSMHSATRRASVVTR